MLRVLEMKDSEKKVSSWKCNDSWFVKVPTSTDVARGCDGAVQSDQDSVRVLPVARHGALPGPLLGTRLHALVLGQVSAANVFFSFRGQNIQQSVRQSKRCECSCHVS